MSPECVLSVPIKNGASRVSGVVELVNKEPGMSPYFSTDDEFIVKTFAAVTSLLALSVNLDLSVVSEQSETQNAAFAASAAIANEIDLNGNFVSNLLTRVSK